jgi:hypothetical protein
LDGRSILNRHPMRYGTATVTKPAGVRSLTVTVRVAVERPDRPESSYLRCAAGHAPECYRAAALSGARFARHAIDRHCFGIEVCEVSGSLDDPTGDQGAAIAAMFAVWRAWDYRWTDAEAQQTMGWSLQGA